MRDGIPRRPSRCQGKKWAGISLLRRPRPHEKKTALVCPWTCVVPLYLSHMRCSERKRVTPPAKNFWRMQQWRRLNKVRDVRVKVYNFINTRNWKLFNFGASDDSFWSLSDKFCRERNSVTLNSCLLQIALPFSNRIPFSQQWTQRSHWVLHPLFDSQFQEIVLRIPQFVLYDVVIYTNTMRDELEKWLLRFNTGDMWQAGLVVFRKRVIQCSCHRSFLGISCHWREAQLSSSTPKS